MTREISDDKIRTAQMKLDAHDLHQLLQKADAEGALGEHPVVQEARTTFRGLAARLLAEVWSMTTTRGEGGRFRIEAGAIEMRAVEGGVDVEASDDVQIRGEVVKLN